jgi:dTDP-4-amino-4,6-dideoxygalactose transaminase
MYFMLSWLPLYLAQGARFTLPQIMAVARRKNIPVLEDSCQPVDPATVGERLEPDLLR